IVPGSTLMYGSSLMSATRSPRLSSKQPMDDAASPLPRLETTPPVTMIYLGIGFSIYLFIAAIAGFRRIFGFLFAVVTSLLQIFQHLDCFFLRRIECFLYANQTSAEQAWSFLCAPLKLFDCYIVGFAQL